MMNRIHRWAYLIIGTIITALAMSMVTHGNFGNITASVLWDGMSRKMGITIGQASYITAVLMIAFCLFYDRGQVKLGTVIHFLLYGAALDLFNILLFSPENIPARIGLAAAGILLLGIGIGIYAYANLGRGPYEGICYALSEKNGWQMKYVRTILDAVLVLIGFLLGGAVGISTIANVLAGGVIIQFTTKTLDRVNRPPLFKIN